MRRHLRTFRGSRADRASFALPTNTVIESRHGGHQLYRNNSSRSRRGLLGGSASVTRLLYPSRDTGRGHRDGQGSRRMLPSRLDSPWGVVPGRKAGEATLHLSCDRASASVVVTRLPTLDCTRLI